MAGASQSLPWRRGALIESQIHLLPIGAAAFQAVVLEGGTKVLVEIDGGGFAGAKCEATGEAEQG
jgi:hypothetical protein